MVRVIEEDIKVKKKCENSTDLSVSAIADSYNKISLDFLRKYAETQKGKNVVFSPFSVMALLLMLADTADGKSREEITSICQGVDFNEMKTIFHSLASVLEDEGAFCNANVVCVKKEYKDLIKEQYKKSLSEVFNGELFASDNMVQAVNDWVCKRTKGMIEQITIEDNADMTAFLMNAVAFEAAWEVPYHNDSIEEDTFKNADGEKQKVQMLFNEESNYIEDEHFTGFVKHYKTEEYSFMGLLPKKKSQKYLYESLNHINFREIFSAKVDEEVKVWMPEFKYTYEADLIGFCQDQGIHTIFSDEADFSPMTDASLFIDAIQHKAVIKVDRRGTKAAAVTYGCYLTGKPYDGPKKVKLNRPFIYAIMHNDTGLPVFVGVVNHIDMNGVEEDPIKNNPEFDGIYDGFHLDNALSGDPLCYVWLGKAFFDGEGCEKSIKKCFKWLQKAYDLDSDIASDAIESEFGILAGLILMLLKRNSASIGQ